MSSSFPIQPFPGIAKRDKPDETAGEGSSTGNPMERISAGFDALIAQLESGHYESHTPPPEKKPRPERKKPAAPKASGTPARRKKRAPSNVDDID